MKKKFKLLFAAGIILQAVFVISACNEPPKETEENKPAPGMTEEQKIERGEYLVTIASCNDCHSPKIMTPNGPITDTTRLLSGSPSEVKLPSIDATEITPGKWYLGSADLTAWVGPWGISFAANLTPDSATGSGTWTEDLFIKILRSGKFMGVEAGRPIMPPMPWEYINKMTDEDLKCVFAYIHSLPVIKNSVHAYVPPNEVKNYK
jgi:hypothetical protein